MKIRKTFLVLLALCVLATLTLCGCSNGKGQGNNGDNSDVNNEIQQVITTISLNEKTLELYVGTSYKLNCSTNSENALTFTSDDETIATVGKDGTVTAISAGTCNILVSVDNKTAACELTVLDNEGAITVSSETLLLEQGATFNLNPVFAYNGVQVSDVTFSYSLSKEGVVTVTDGEVVVVGYGETEITVACTYKGVETKKIVSVNVKEDVTIAIEPLQGSLYAFDEDGYPSKKDLTATVIVCGQVVSNPTIVWTSSNENIVTVEGNSITAQGKGSAIVKATYVSASGIEYSQGLQVNVQALQKVHDGNLILSRSGDYENELQGIDVSVIEKITFAQKNLYFTIKGEKIVVSAEDASSFDAGVYEAIVCTNKYDYVVKGLVATATIGTTAEFVDMLASAKECAAESKAFTGYYILTKSLDFTGVDVVSSLMLTNNQQFSNNWQATFDGQGYALENIDYSWYNSNGLFGEIGTDGVIKNVAIINPKNADNNIFNGYGGIVAYNNAGLIENVYVRVASIYDSALNGGLVKYSAQGSTIRNCVIEYNGGSLLNAALYLKTNGGATISNCYAITSAIFPDSSYGTKVASVAALFTTVNNGLSMLNETNNEYYWGKTPLGEYSVVWTDISTTDEFVAMLQAAKTAGAQEGGFTGYYRLTKSLDFTGVDVVSALWLTNAQQFTKGWQATFDGQGYALENIDLSWMNANGLFGEIGYKGVIRNLAIINPMSGDANKFNGYGGIIAMNNAGLIENVYVRVESINDHANNGALVKYNANGSVMRNCVIEYAGGNLTNAALYFKSNGGAMMSNCYAITSATFPDVELGTTKASIADLYGTADNGLSMLTKSGENYYWGNYKL